MDTHITKELRQEGIARELINRINTLRKQEGFEVTDRIALTIEASQEIEEAYHGHREYIAGEVLAREIAFAPVHEGKEVEVNETPVKMALRRL